MMSVRGDLSQVLDGSGQGGGRSVRRKTGDAKSTMRDMRQQARISIELCPIIKQFHSSCVFVYKEGRLQYG